MIPDFAEFFAACHGYGPFRWQEDLAASIAAGETPDAVPVPTGMGKTAIIDAWVWALAAVIGTDVVVPRRLWLVVDRRIVVDDAYLRAGHIAGVLSQTVSPLGDGAAADHVKAVADLLSGYAAAGGWERPARPLTVARLRGAHPDGGMWNRRPDLPLAVMSTVDQFGSRLLFRGYGVSERQRSVAAALAGTDSLVVLDEAHISEPFRQTVEAVSAAQRSAPEPIGRGIHLVQMTATPRATVGTTLRFDRDDHRGPVPDRRLSAKRLFTIDEVAEKKGVPARLAVLGHAAVTEGGAQVVGVVCNRVKEARETYAALRRAVGKDNAGQVLLLHGRQRPHDREQLLNEWLPRIRANRKRDGSGPWWVVATQTVEVGADLDFDHLVTRLCPWDNLLQRVGRLDRIGDLHERGVTARVDIVRCPKTDGYNDDGVPLDVLYGAATPQTGAFLDLLAAEGSVDLGYDGRAAADIDGRVPPGAVRVPTNAPIVTSFHLRSWAETSPPPTVDVDPDPFLHGIGSRSTDVGVCWRAEIDVDDPDRWVSWWGRSKTVRATLAPRTHEVCSAPLTDVRAWLRGRTEPPDTSDAENVPETSLSQGKGRRPLAERVVIVRHGNAEVVAPAGIRPGDTVVVPASFGGLDRHGWSPTVRTAAAVPLRDSAIEGTRSRYVGLRGAVAGDKATALLEVALAAIDADPDDPDAVDPFEAVLKAAAADGWAPDTGARVSWDVLRDSADDPVATVLIEGSRRYGEALVGAPVALAEHAELTSERARTLAAALRLPRPVAAALERGALLHDEGKRDDRFQAMLRSSCTTDAGVALAKSGRPAWGATAALARRTAKVPDRFLHEAYSAALADRGLEPELVVWVVGTHHGSGRPAFPPCASPPVRGGDDDGTTPQQHLIDDRWVNRFDDLRHRYGDWGLALAETVVRAADWDASATHDRDPR